MCVFGVGWGGVAKDLAEGVLVCVMLLRLALSNVKVMTKLYIKILLLFLMIFMSLIYVNCRNTSPSPFIIIM